MRVRIIFNLKNKGGIVPFHHQHILARLIEEIHPVKDFQAKSASKIYYNFSGLKGQTRVGKYGLHFYSNKVTLVFSSSDKNHLDSFLGKIFNFRELTIGQLRLAPDTVLLEDLPPFKTNKEGNKFVVISPLVVVHPKESDRSPKDFISPDTDEFSDLLYDSTMAKLENAKAFTPEELESFAAFQFMPDPEYMKKVREQEKKIARIYTVYLGAEKNEVRGYTIPFTLYAEKKVLDFVFNYGLGELGHKGFGMIDAVGNDFSRRVKPYRFQEDQDSPTQEELDQLYSYSFVPKQETALN